MFLDVSMGNKNAITRKMLNKLHILLETNQK